MALTKKPDYAFKHTAQIDEPVFATTAELKTALDSQAVELRAYINDLLTAEIEAQFATKTELTEVVTGDIPDGSLGAVKLSFDPATQAELDTHKGSADHDGRYFTESEVTASLALKVDKSIAVAQGDMFYATGVDTIVRLPKGTARQGLLMNTGATAPNWQDSLQSLLTATGDMILGSSANTPARLAMGSALQYLRVNSGGTGLEYGALPFQVVAGSYTGNGASNRTISIGITPKFVMVAAASTILDSSGISLGSGASIHAYGNIAEATNSNALAPQVTSGGFTVSSGANSINTNGNEYRYFTIA